MIFLYMVFLLVNSIIAPVLTLSGGAPLASCGTLEVRHGSNVPQTSESPYTINTQALNIGGENLLQVELHSTSTFIRGFAMHAINTSPPYQTVGRFLSSPLFRSVNCSGTDSTVTHINTNEKTDLLLLWEAPDDFTGEIIFKASVTQSFSIFWTEIESKPVTVPLSVPDEQDVFNYAECGLFKNCFGFPSGCIATRSCIAITSARLVGDIFEFELLSTHEEAGYVSTGLSVTGLMPNSSIIECTAGDTVSAYASYTSGERPYFSSRNGVPQNIIRLVNGSFVDGVIYCKVERIAVGTVIDQEFDLHNQNYHVLVAIGREFTDTSIQMHNLGRWASERSLYLSEIQDNEPEPTPEITTLEPPQDNEIYDGCGETKNCFGMPAGCESSRTCRALSTVVGVGDKFVFEIMTVLSNAAYVAVGLSRDGTMAESSVIECIPTAYSVSVDKSLASGRPNFASSRDGIISQDIISLVEGSVQDGITYCKVERVPFGMVNNEYFNLNTNPYHLLVAAGSVVYENTIGTHDLGRIASQEAFLLSDINEFTAATNLLVRLHASFMITAWVLCSTIGIFMAKYFKQTWDHVKVGGVALWFVVHQSCMVLTWALTVAAFIIIFVDSGTWTIENNPHAILGLIASIFCFIQPFGAMLRPAPTHRHRKIFNFFHFLGGYGAQILAVVAIMFAFTLARSELPYWFPFLMGGFIVFNLIVEVILLVLRIKNDRRNTEDLKPTTEDTSSTTNIFSTLEQDKYAEIKKLILFVYIIGAVAFMTALVVVVSLSPFDE